jgi:hypothetical protein
VPTHLLDARLGRRQLLPQRGSCLANRHLKAPVRQNLNSFSPVGCFDSPVGYAAAFNSKPSGSKPVFT